ncbi:M1 family aminopeptidase [Myxococcus sp. MxC21-1]|nr:M1 family aminopeptidase [Myxococcus sp. MxC21-1]
MPPSFPYGGMENPRLTFLTPTLITGDKSLVNVVAHELAHSWTGNLVTNASAEHFWLNEGFTVFAERRILEVLEGPEVSALHGALGRRALDSALQHFRAHPQLTSLRTHRRRGPGRGLLPDSLREGLPAAARHGGRGRAARLRRVPPPLPPPTASARSPPRSSSPSRRRSCPAC